MLQFVYEQAMIDFVKSLRKVQYEDICLLALSSTNSMSCVSQEQPFRNPCCSGYRILFSSPRFMILLANICSIILQQTDVKDIGLQFSANDFSCRQARRLQCASHPAVESIPLCCNASVLSKIRSSVILWTKHGRTF